MTKNLKNVYFMKKPISIGGPSSFQIRFENKLRENGYKIIYANSKICKKNSVIFIIGRTKKIFWLLKNKIYGTKIILRLDGINDYSYHFKDGFLNFVKSRIINIIVNFIRCRLANHIVYQSLYVRKVWKTFGATKSGSSVIYNAVDLNEFYPTNKDSKLLNAKIVVVEGTVQGPLAVNALNAISFYKVDIYGSLQKEIKKKINEVRLKNLNFHGPVPRHMIPKVLIGKKIYLCLEINPACPNSVIEALASGVPVVGFDSGSLSELVGNAGIILKYTGGNADKMESPNCNKLNYAINKINKNYKKYSMLARARAKKLFSSNNQYEKYIQILKS